MNSRTIMQNPGGLWRRNVLRISVIFYVYIVFRFLFSIWSFSTSPSSLHQTHTHRCVSSPHLYEKLRGRDTASLSQLLADGCTYFDLAWIFYQNNNYHIAIILYEQGLSKPEEATSDLGPVYQHLSESYGKLDLTESATYYAWKAFNTSHRAEFMLDLAERYQSIGDMKTAQQLYSLACLSPPGSTKAEKEVEKMDKSFLWPSFFSNSYTKHMQAFEAVLNDPDASEEIREHLHWEMVTRTRPILQCGQELFRREGRFGDGKDYYYATPSLIRHPNKTSDYLVLVRLLNYRIDQGGRYYKEFLPVEDTTGILRSASALFTGLGEEEGNILQLNDDQYEKTPYRFLGTEDPKLFQMENGEIRAFWISWEYSKIVGEGSRVATGVLDVSTLSISVDHVFRSPFGRFLEKNWVVFRAPGEPLRFVYEWHPLKIGKMVESFATEASTIDLDVELETPRSFKYIRGSSNGVNYKGDVWFLVHGTSWHSGPGPLYYHRMVVLEPNTFRLIRYTYPFKLESEDAPVEFSLGMDIDAEDRVVIAYSVFDGSSVVRRIAMWKMEALMAV